jgi:thiamine biosynthesis lipoprotein
MVDGQLYHHIIDPHTLYPGTLWRAVTVVCEDSGLADALSTALFLLPQAEGLALLEKCGAEAMWVAADGSIAYSPGFSKFVRT